MKRKDCLLRIIKAFEEQDFVFSRGFSVYGRDQECVQSNINHLNQRYDLSSFQRNLPYLRDRKPGFSLFPWRYYYSSWGQDVISVIGVVLVDDLENVDLMPLFKHFDEAMIIVHEKTKVSVYGTMMLLFSQSHDAQNFNKSLSNYYAGHFIKETYVSAISIDCESETLTHGNAIFGLKWQGGFHIPKLRRAVFGQEVDTALSLPPINEIKSYINGFYELDTVFQPYFSEGLAHVENVIGEYGFIDESKKVVIPCQWQDAEWFQDGLALVMDETKQWGAIDKNGNMVIPCLFEDIQGFSEGLAVVNSQNFDYYYIDKSGCGVFSHEQFHWREAGSFSDGLARVEDYDGSIGYIDKTGMMVVKSPFKLRSEVADADYALPIERVAFCDQETGTIVLPLESGNAVIELDYLLNDGLGIMIDKEGRYGYYDKYGNVVSACQWKDAYGFSEEMAAVQDDTGNYGFIDASGKLVIPCQWPRVIRGFSDGVALVTDKYIDDWDIDPWDELEIDKTGNYE